MAPPQMCHSQSHHVTLGMTIGRSLRAEGPDRPREPERERERDRSATGSSLDTRQLQSWWEERPTLELHRARQGQGTTRESGSLG